MAKEEGQAMLKIEIVIRDEESDCFIRLPRDDPKPVGP